MSEQALENLLKDFSPMDTECGPRDRRALTIWLSPEDKARYDRLQRLSRGAGRKFSDIVRDATLLVIKEAEQRAS